MKVLLVILFVVFLSSCTLPEKSSGWPPSFDFDRVSVSGSLILDTPEGQVLIALDTGFIEGAGEDWSVLSVNSTAKLGLFVNGEPQTMTIKAPGKRHGGLWLQCVSGTLDVSVIGIPVSYTWIPEGLKEHCSVILGSPLSDGVKVGK